MHAAAGADADAVPDIRAAPVIGLERILAMAASSI
jgi:hypothetical protein